MGIPELRSGRITSNTTYENKIKVKDIILNSRRWDDYKLQNLFLPFECEAIRKIPIREIEEPDSRYWKHEKKGSYSVRTSY